MTSGVLSKKPDLSPVWKVQARFRPLTFFVLICVNVENLVPPASWPNEVQLFCPARRDDDSSATAATTADSFFMTVGSRQSNGRAPGSRYRAGSVAGALIGCGFRSALVMPSDHLMASRYICCTSRMSQVLEACANEP